MNEDIGDVVHNLLLLFVRLGIVLLNPRRRDEGRLNRGIGMLRLFGFPGSLFSSDCCSPWKAFLAFKSVSVQCICLDI